MTVVLQCCDGCAALYQCFRVNCFFKAMHATSNLSQHDAGCSADLCCTAVQGVLLVTCLCFYCAGSNTTQLSPHWRNILDVFQTLLATLIQNYVPPFLVRPLLPAHSCWPLNTLPHGALSGLALLAEALHNVWYSWYSLHERTL